MRTLTRRLAGLTLSLAAAGCAAPSVHYAPAGEAAAVPLQRVSRRAHTLYAFDNVDRQYGLPRSPAQDGERPKGTLTLVTGKSGVVLYGRTTAGGNGTQCGTIFSIRPNGTSYRVVHRFSGNDGCDPRHDAMLADPVFGYLWSTTQGVSASGHAYLNGRSSGNGQILAIDPQSGRISIEHRFRGAPDDGSQQHSSFSFRGGPGSSTTLYGQSAFGGKFNEGEIYSEVLGSGTTTRLLDFDGKTGEQPHGRVLLLGDQLWGITRYKGGSGQNGFGTVYVLALGAPPAKAKPVVVHVFRGGAGDGALSDHGYLTPVPTPGGFNAVLYGMTECGGSGAGPDEPNCKSSGGGDGVIFQIDPQHRTYNTFWQFRGSNAGDGADPYGSLLYDPASGYLYGTTVNGGAHDKGTVFRIKPRPFGTTGRMEVLYSFTGVGGDGANPYDNVIAADNVLYGMTYEGGTGDSGTVFSLNL
jgi:uncharacterized repeat protein (TIGR03803 family)